MRPPQVEAAAHQKQEPQIAGAGNRASEVAILTLERLYPLPAKELGKQLRRFDHVEELRWVQDEPANQGAWPFIALNMMQRLTEVEPGQNWRLTKVTRPESSAPSVGSASIHLQQQRALMEAALA